MNLLVELLDIVLAINNFYYFIYKILGWILLVDIALTFNTACYDKGELIFNRRLIAKSYFNSSFIFDFLASFIFFISRKINIPYLDIILFLRFNKVIKIEKLFAE